MTEGRALLAPLVPVIAAMPLAVSADIQYVAVPPFRPGWAGAAAAKAMPANRKTPDKRLVLVMRGPI